MEKISYCLWFEDNAEKAAEFYTNIFRKSKINNSIRYDEASAKVSGMPVGSVLYIEFEIEGQKFLAMNGGPIFKITPAISFIISCKAEEIDSLWETLSENGKILMEYGKYPFSEKYGWVNDKFGLSWQIILDDGHYNYKHKITPTLMFGGNVRGKEEEAMGFYASIFPESKIGDITRYPEGMEPDKEGTIMHGAAQLAKQEFFFMDSAREHNFNFTEAVSLIVECKDQKEIDHYWEKLSAVPESEQCGWLKDKYGVSWQITPTVLEKMLQDKDSKKAKRAMIAMLQMKKIEIDELEKAYKGK